MQFVVNGIMTGGLYGLIAVSLVIIYKATKVFNFAVGSLLTLSGFICLTFIEKLQFPFWLAFLAALLLSGLIGALVERLTLRPLLSQPVLVLVMATLLLDSIIYGLTLIFWTGYTYSFPMGTIPGSTLHIGQLFLSHELFYAFIAVLVCFTLIGLLFQKTHIGLKMRSTAEDFSTSMTLGINVKNIFTLTWILAGIVVAMAGILLGNRLGLQAAITPAIAFKAIPATIFGGLDSITGALIGGLVVGIIEQLTGGLMGSAYAEISPYVVLLLVLFIRPEGLFGTKRIERI